MLKFFLGRFPPKIQLLSINNLGAQCRSRLEDGERQQTLGSGLGTAEKEGLHKGGPLSKTGVMILLLYPKDAPRGEHQLFHTNASLRCDLDIPPIER